MKQSRGQTYDSNKGHPLPLEYGLLREVTWSTAIATGETNHRPVKESANHDTWANRGSWTSVPKWYRRNDITPS
jgi:hypothetical protein